MTQREIEEQVRLEKIEYENLLRWTKSLAKEEHPHLMQKERKFIMRFYKNQNEYWLPYDKTEKSEDQIDIYDYEDGYLYYLHEKGFDVLIFARDLFYDFNKPTDKYGNICRLSDANCRLRANLNGYYWEINNIDPKDIYKCEYFQNRHGTRYASQTNEFYNMLIGLTNLNKGSKFVLSNLQKTKSGIVWGNLISPTEENESLQTQNIIEENFFEDVLKTNPQDLKDIKKAFNR